MANEINVETWKRTSNFTPLSPDWAGTLTHLPNTAQAMLCYTPVFSKTNYNTLVEPNHANAWFFLRLIVLKFMNTNVSTSTGAVNLVSDYIADISIKCIISPQTDSLSQYNCVRVTECKILHRWNIMLHQKTCVTFL